MKKFDEIFFLNKNVLFVGTYLVILVIFCFLIWQITFSFSSVHWKPAFLQQDASLPFLFILSFFFSNPFPLPRSCFYVSWKWRINCRNLLVLFIRGWPVGQWSTTSAGVSMSKGFDFTAICMAWNRKSGFHVLGGSVISQQLSTIVGQFSQKMSLLAVCKNIDDQGSLSQADTMCLSVAYFMWPAIIKLTDKCRKSKCMFLWVPMSIILMESHYFGSGLNQPMISSVLLCVYAPCSLS